MNPEIHPSQQEQEVPPPKITEVENPMNHEMIKQEVRFSADGKPSEVFMFDTEGKIIAYENLAALEKVQIEEIQRQMFIELHNEREYYSKKGPIKS